MKCLRSYRLLPPLLAIAGCTASPAPPASAPVDGQIIYDFAALPGGFGESNSSFGFPIDLRHPVKNITEPSPDQIMTIYDRVGCWTESGLRSGLDSHPIPAGDAAIVSEVDLVLKSIDAQPHPAGVCFGYRQLDGTWHFDLTVVQPTLDPSGQMSTRLVVPAVAIDAFEIAREDVYGPNIVRMTVHAAQATR